MRILDGKTPNIEHVMVSRHGEPVTLILAIDLGKMQYTRQVGKEVVTESLRDCLVSGLEKVLTLEEWSEYIRR